MVRCMKGFYAVFLVRAVEQGDAGPVEKIRRLAVWVEGSLAVEVGAAPVPRSELVEASELVTHSLTAEEVSALVDDLEVKV